MSERVVMLDTHTTDDPQHKTLLDSETVLLLLPHQEIPDLQVPCTSGTDDHQAMQLEILA